MKALFSQPLNGLSTHFIITRKQLCTIMADIISPEVQRAIDKEHVQKIVSYQQNLYTKYKCYDFSQPLMLAKFNNKFYILDGGHRLECIKQLPGDFNVPIVVYDKFKSADEIRDKFAAINNNKPIILALNDPEYDNCNKICKLVMGKFGHCHSRSLSPKIPNFNIDKFSKRFRKHDAQRVISAIDTLNAFAVKQEIELLRSTNLTKANRHYIDLMRKCSAKKCYIRIFPDYETILEKIVQNQPWQHTCGVLQQRHKITPAERELVFRREFGVSNLGICCSCGKTIDINNFHCGHIQALANGGEDTTANMKPICATCNLRMSTQSIYTFHV
jgi:5-methylcytosine-specific restriction endonuclease McrA